MANSRPIIALIVAAGRGVRAGSREIPKQYQAIGGIPMLRRSLDLLLSHPGIDRVRVAIADADRALYAAIAPENGKLGPAVSGGETRQISVCNGLAAIEDTDANVLIHDAARPFASPALVTRVADALMTAEAVIPAVPVASTLKQANADGVITATVPRANLYAAETPQGFRLGLIRAAHQKAAAAGMEFTDDAAVAEWAGHEVRIVEGEATNMKITTAADIATANRSLRAEDALRLGDVRTGIGYDVHPFGPGHEVMLGGVAVPHTRGLVGHSDADVMLHALTDAVLGAIGEGDIGAHFPPSDPQWKGASSDRFLSAAAERVRARGGMIGHLDVSLVAEEPRIGEYRELMRARIAEIAGIGIDRVGVKATTNENLGFIGRSEGAAAYAVATIRLPFAE
jgi:2-C-methyl-D-erythritol 4-phosphate cytidylyltransferase/2-C-methyl-D-erythritol 2,4-cyclodiphosphate synthase